MNYLLDSNACIVFLNKRSDKLKQRLELCEPQQIVLCSVVKAELLYGGDEKSAPTSQFAQG
ncbi:hypothetical protein NP590_09445 [Methylomonas sp. SURF-2]|uniref:PIN domain-containing protein n=1 Tax=Methylomonas subterranea TaxID=2952225 RepID=A0ABT1TGV2_9GAMM|nr:hypothetical protein [Methylomonas sp. SURF-2]MCQ8104327.1 hypothetical protein [Methylomonas sp. SURF-2]